MCKIWLLNFPKLHQGLVKRLIIPDLSQIFNLKAYETAALLIAYIVTEMDFVIQFRILIMFLGREWHLLILIIHSFIL